jgi:hypothetical protein
MGHEEILPMKIAPIDDWPVLADFYGRLARDLHAQGIDTLTTGGIACVVYSLTQKTKDCDIIIPIPKAKDVLEVLAHTELQGHACHLTLKYGAPFDGRWFNGGWSSHTYFGALAKPIARVDFFGNPPRIRTLDTDENPLMLSRDGVARMKKSRREKDWAFANLLGEQMLLRGEPAGLLHVTDPRRLVSAVHKTRVTRDLLAERPLLQLAVSGSPELKRYIKAEKDFWTTLDDLRLKAYENAWLPYGTAIQKDSRLLHMRLKEQNTALVKIAEQLLDQDPLATVGWHNLVDQAKQETAHTFHDLDLNLLPNPHSFFGRRDGGAGENDPEL